MNNIALKAIKVAAAMGALTAVASPALADNWHRDRHHDRRDSDRRDWDGRRDGRYNDVRLHGPGVGDLNPWFRNAKNGRRFAVERAGTYISERDARMLNREFRWRDRGRW